MSRITWRNARVRLADLEPWGDNPRMSSGKQAERIVSSVDRFGQVQERMHEMQLGLMNQLRENKTDLLIELRGGRK